MPLNNSTNIVFIPGDFTSSSPIGGADAAASLGLGSVSSVKWANKTRQINLGNNDYGYVTLDISYTVTGGSMDTVGINISTSDYLISYSNTLNGFFKPSLPGQYIKLTAGVTTRLYVVVNSEIVTSPFVPISLTMGRKGTLPTNVTVNLQYNCTDVGPLYKYLMGVHAYSAYDAINSPQLYTYLYSYTPIGSWTSNTELYSIGRLSHPAYPYYYGYSGNVYKVGGELERSFGIKKYYEAIKWNAFSKPKVYNRVEGPKSWRSSDVDGFTTENFVYPEMPGSGRLSQILSAASLVQPSSYRYYLGASNTAQGAANFFTQFDFTNRQAHTITGIQHAIQKLASGFIAGADPRFKSSQNFGPEMIALAFDLAVLIFGLWWDAKIAGTITSAPVASIANTLVSFLRVFAGGKVGGTGIFAGFKLSVFGLGLWQISAIIAVISIIIKLFTPTPVIIQEPSITFKYRYANTPYLNNGTTLYTNTGLTTSKSEYYCDGIYFYDQTAGTIANKELSYSTNALLNLDPLQKGIAYSTKVDTPDSASVIFDFTKLIALPYCSGKPDTITGTNKNITQTATFTPLNKGGDLLTYPLTVTVEIPAGTIATTGSQALANAEAKTLLNNLTSSYAASGSYGQVISGLGGFGSYFTHEIKVETYPNTGSVFFNNNDGAGLVVGKSLYYDNAGFLKVFNGYYAADSGSVNSYSNYRTFFKTSNGTVTDILSMASSGATTVTSLVNSATYPVQTSNQGYTSDWYWYDVSYNDLSTEIYNITTTNTNPNSLYTTSSLKSGFVTPNTSSFFTYDSISSTSSYSEAVAGWYYAFDSYEESYTFTYNTATTISINLTEVCFTDYAVGEPYGINISGATGSASSSFYYPVNMTLKAYNGGTLLATFPATASAEGVTYVSFPAPITKDSNVTNVTVDSISSPNPNNKILYVAGSFTNCNPTTPAPTTAAPTTAAPTTAAPTTPSPTTPAPTAAPPSFSFLVNNVGRLDGELACATTSRTRTLYAYDSDFSQAERFYTTNTFPYEPFDGLDRWYSDGVNAVQINTSGYAADMIVCPTPAPTPNPTTAAPTTPPTPPPTNPPTTPPTPPPTNPPTPPPTAPFSAIVSYSNISALDACSNPQGSFSMTGNNGTFCLSSAYTATNWTSLPQTTYWLAYNGQVRQVYHPANSNTVTTTNACADCPTPSPTTAPTTAAPTTPPTPPPTTPPTPPPTNPPTTPPTPPPTNPPTPAPTAPFSAIVAYSNLSAQEACNNPQGSFSMTGNNATFCASSAYTATNWTTQPTGTYWLAYNGQVRQVFHPSNANTVTTTNACADCPTPSPTAAPTTAAPTTPPTPPPTTPPTPPPTTPPTTPPTPAPTQAPPQFSFLVTNGRVNSGLACATTAKPVTLYAYDSDFSLADRFYSTNTFPYTVFNGNDLWYSNGIDAVQINTVGYPIDAIVCPTPAPTTPPTPPPTNPPTTPPTPPPTNPPTTPPTPPPTPPPTTPPTPPPTTPPTPPPTPPPTTPPTPPPTTPPTPPPTPNPTEVPYYYYDVTPCFSGGSLVARSLSPELNGVYAANGTCYIIQGITFPQEWAFTIDAANYQGGSCFVSGCGYTPPPVPAPTVEFYTCEPFVGCYPDQFSTQSFGECSSLCPQP